ncbi:preprotein translocase subunit SecG [Xinfangfangia sp. D13-10-4-6]|uniref:preprotein translocase subunit SecG n=1 Tax=Pseudogemmobacter hezensis TaxID=2737662 RepID=UPI001557206D|nr:preprotein translocase subunit SecG [Pseudogemmobacter hezensis]NPD13757.1 preprotein translocase subunit SecG [Pseudogemmobacter hezensis]
MENVVLTIHLILALLLIGVVLVQKSEGSALLSGGGNMQARAKPNALTRVTWILAAAFIVTSLTLGVLATRGSGSGSVLDGMMPPATNSDGATPPVSGMMPPPSGANVDPGAPPVAADPAAPPAADAPAADTPAETPAPAADPATPPAAPAN